MAEPLPVALELDAPARSRGPAIVEEPCVTSSNSAPGPSLLLRSGARPASSTLCTQVAVQPQFLFPSRPKEVVACNLTPPFGLFGSANRLPDSQSMAYTVCLPT